MPIEDIFTITGRGTVISGRVECGSIRAGDEVEIVGLKPTIKTLITDIQRFKKLFECVDNLGDNTGLLLGDIKREDIERGQVVATPGFITAHTKFQCEVQHFPDISLDARAGGKYNIFIRSIHMSAIIEVLSNSTFNVNLEIPIAIKEGCRFLILQPGSKISDNKTFGTQIVSKIIE